MSTSSSLAEALRARGLRLTAPRQLVLEAVYALEHATPDQVHAAVARRAAGVNITTVYRTLELLEDLGLVTHTHLSHGAPTYHPTGVDQHLHLVCHECGHVDEMPPTVLGGLVAELADGRGFLLDVGHVALFGLCAACAAQPAADAVQPVADALQSAADALQPAADADSGGVAAEAAGSTVEAGVASPGNGP